MVLKESALSSVLPMLSRHIRWSLQPFGNSAGDLPMAHMDLRRARSAIVPVRHHTDALRERAYDRHSPLGHLDKGLDAENAKCWTVVNMTNDWKTVFPSAPLRTSGDLILLRGRI